MLDGQETVEIAWGELRWQGTRHYSSRGNGLGRVQCRAVVAALSEAVGTFFQDKCYHCDCPEKLWVQDVEIAGGELRRERATLKCKAFGSGVFRTISINAIVLKNCGSKTWK